MASLVVNYHKRELVAAAMAALLFSLGIGWWLNSKVSQAELKPVLVAARDLTAQKIISKDDVKLAKAPRAVIPKKSLLVKNLIVGKMLTRSISANQIFTALDVSYTRDPNSESALVPSGLLGFVLPESWLAAPFPKIKPDDWLSVYVGAGGNGKTEAQAGAVIKEAPVLAVTSGRDSGTDSVLLALDATTLERLVKARASQYLLVAVVESGATATVGEE